MQAWAPELTGFDYNGVEPVKQNVIFEKIRTAQNLPSLPSVAIEVLRLTQADDLSVADIARVIQQDPALTSKILRTVNSSLFGMSRKISSLQQATVVLGLRTVKVMVLSFSLVDAMDGKKTHGFDYTVYWRRSLTTAVTARLFAEKLYSNAADEAFVGGLLCDIGILASIQCAPELYAPVIKLYRQDKSTLQAAEQQILGVSHDSTTGDLLTHWGLPDDLCSAIREHHQPMKTTSIRREPHELMVRILQCAALIADLFVADTHAGALSESKQSICNALQMSELDLDSVLGMVDKHVRETAFMFSLNIGHTLGFQEIQAAAAMQLAQLSVMAELERAETAKREQQAQLRVQQLNDQNKQLSEKAETDALTGIPNRGAFDHQLVRDHAACRQRRAAMGLIFMDLDRFKKLNDTFGHQAGDETLRQIGGLLRQIMTEKVFASRYGGEEFAVVATDLTARELRALAEDIRLRVAKLRIPYQGKYIPVTASLGVAYASEKETSLSASELLKRADQCLYEAKNNGRNRVVYTDSRQAAGPAGHFAQV